MTAPAPIALDESREIRCPRCGYDQRGVVDAWRDSCPLQGVCSECGLDFPWDELFHPDRFAPQWCVEFAPTRMGIPLATVKTALRSFWPWSFWKRLKMSHPIRWRRLACYLILWLLPLVLVYVGMQMSVATIVLRGQRRSIAASQANLPNAIARISGPPRALPVGSDVLPSMKIMMRGEQSTRTKMLIRVYQQYQLTPMALNQTWGRAMFEAVFTPLSQQTKGTITLPNMARDGTYLGPLQVPAHAPIDLYDTLFSNMAMAVTPGASAPSYRYRGWESAQAGLILIVTWTFVLLLLPLSLALLPASRRKARVRWGHIVRVCIYSLFIPGIAVYAGVALTMPQFFVTTPTASSLRMWQTLLTVGIVPLAMICWWWAAIKHYLRIPQALLTTIMMFILCVLAVGAATFYIGMAFFSRA